MESGVRSSLQETCQHQLLYAKFNLKMSYPPPCERKIWHYEHANADPLKRAIEQFPCEKSFRNLRINEMAYYLTKLLKIFSQITFPMKQLLVMIETHLGLTTRLSS